MVIYVKRYLGKYVTKPTDVQFYYNKHKDKWLEFIQESSADSLSNKMTHPLRQFSK